MTAGRPLDALVDGLEASTLSGDPGVAILAVHHDSRSVEPGSLFCCVPGRSTDGHAHAGAAVEAGAVALLVEHPPAVPEGPTVVQVPSVRRAMGPVSSRAVGDPSHTLAVVGITGTNGKTTTATLTAQVLDLAGVTSSVIGTLTGERTTPEAPELQRQLAARRDRGDGAVVMEVSSHALDARRVDGTRFRVAAFTNLSRDHLDHHGSMEAYFRSKARLFTPELCDRAVVNLDDPHGRLLLDAAVVPTTGWSLAEAEGLELSSAGARFTWRGQQVSLPLTGRFNVANAIAAAHLAAALGVGDGDIAAGLSAALVVPGRMERIDAGQPFTVLVDFAHTPDGLEQVLVAARELAGAARVHVAFGCGGDRDETKRPAMGAAAARLADRVVLTSDNSRSEPTEAIIDAIREGAERADGRRADVVVVEADRAAAIDLVLTDVAPDDVVVIAGKGHEVGQTIGGRTVPFDDRDVARALLEARRSSR